MAHDPLFEQRIAETLAAQGAKAEVKKMFGGVAFMVNGNMSVGITNKGDFMARFTGERHAEISKWPGAKPMTFGRGDTKGFLFVDAWAVSKNAALAKWVKLSLEHVRTLPKKKVAPKDSLSTPKKAARKAATRKK